MKRKNWNVVDDEHGTKVYFSCTMHLHMWCLCVCVCALSSLLHSSSSKLCHRKWMLFIVLLVWVCSVCFVWTLFHFIRKTVKTFQFDTHEPVHKCFFVKISPSLKLSHSLLWINFFFGKNSKNENAIKCYKMDVLTSFSIRNVSGKFTCNRRQTRSHAHCIQN